MNNNSYQLSWLKNKFLQEIKDLLLKFTISALIVISSYIVLKIIPSDIPLFDRSTNQLLTYLLVVIVTVLISISVIKLLLQARRNALLLKATKARIDQNEGAYSLEEMDSRPLTIFMKNSSSFEDELIAEKISRILLSSRLLRSENITEGKQKFSQLEGIMSSDIFMLILDKEMKSGDKEDYRCAVKQNKTTFVLLKKDNWDAEKLLGSFLNDLPTKIAFFSSIDDLSEETKLLVSDTLISGYRRSRKFNYRVPKSINRIHDNIAGNPVAVTVRTSEDSFGFH
jgi:hypothetical protein